MIRRLYSFSKSGRTETLTGLAVPAAAVGLELLQPWPIKWLVDHVLGNRPPSARVSAWLQIFGSKHAAGPILVICLAIVLLALTLKAAHVVSNLLMIRAGEKLVFELRCAA